MKFFAQVCSSLLAIALGFLIFEPASAVQVIKFSAYWLLLAATLLLIHTSYRVVFESGFRPRLQTLKEQRLPLIVIAVISALFFILQEGEYKIVMDEPLLAATALNMHHEKQAMTVKRAYNIGGTFNILGGDVGKRPNFFPFVVSLLHDLTGYRAYQGVLLNQLLTPVFLGLLYILGHRFGGRHAGYCALALCATVPLFAMNANGGGFDFLNAVMILATLWASILYLRRPTNARMDLMLLLVVLLAQTRYESSMYVLAVIGIILVSWFRQRRIQLTWVSIAAPLLLICVPLQKTILDQYPLLWQLDKSNAETPFSLTMIPQNLTDSLNFFFTLYPVQPGSPLLSGLFCAAMLLGLYLLLRGRLRSFLRETDAPAILWFYGLMVFSFFLMMAYHWGQADDIVATRIVIPFLLFQILFVVAVIGLMPGARKIYGFTVVVAGLFFIGVTRPESAQTDYLLRLVDQKDVQWVLEKVRERKGENNLYITDKQLAVLAEQESCLPYAVAAGAKPEIDLHLKLGTFPEVIVFYTLLESAEGKGDWRPEIPIEKDFEIEVLEEVKLADPLYVRMGLIRSVKFREGDPLPYDQSVLEGLSDENVKLSVFAKTLP